MVCFQNEAANNLLYLPHTAKAFDSFAVICCNDAGQNVICGFELPLSSGKWVKNFVMCIHIFN